MSLVNSNQFYESFSQWKRLIRANLKKGFSGEKKKKAANLGKTNLKSDAKEVCGLINSSKKISGPMNTVKADQQ